MDDVTARACANSITFDEVDGPALEEMQGGQLVCWSMPDDKWAFAAIVRSDLPADGRASFEEWARQRVYRVSLTDDPAGDGWFRRTADRGWQVTSNRMQLWLPAVPSSA
jgi:hypothetical protein